MPNEHPEEVDISVVQITFGQRHICWQTSPRTGSPLPQGDTVLLDSYLFFCTRRYMVTIHISNLFLQKASAVATFAFDSTNKNVITSSTTGSFTLHEVKTHTYNL